MAWILCVYGKAVIYKLIFVVVWGSSTIKTPWSSATTTMLDSVQKEAFLCLFLTPRLEWLRAIVTSGWRKDIEVQV